MSAVLTDDELDKMEADARAKLPEEATTQMGDVWAGSCGDSFCWASCDAAHCKSELRLGKTPSAHNAEVARRTAADPVLILVAEIRRERRAKP